MWIGSSLTASLSRLHLNMQPVHSSPVDSGHMHLAVSHIERCFLLASKLGANFHEEKHD